MNTQDAPPFSNLKFAFPSIRLGVPCAGKPRRSPPLALPAIREQQLRHIRGPRMREASAGNTKYIIAALGMLFLAWVLFVPHKPVESTSPKSVDSTPPGPIPAVSEYTGPKHNLPPAFNIGQPFSIGYWSYVCHSAHWTPIFGSDLYSMERANGKFVVVDITVQNNDTSASTLPPFQLVDKDGRTYDESSSGMVSQGFFSVLEKLNPGVSKRGNIAFDVPPDREYFLLISGGFESGKHAIVVLPMSVVPERQSPPVDSENQVTTQAPSTPT
jgi:hypothetical protein